MEPTAPAQYHSPQPAITGASVLPTQTLAKPSNASDLPADRNLYSIGQAAQYLNVSIDTIRRWEKRGLISAIRTGGNLRRFTRKELESCKKELNNQDVLLPISEAAKELSVSIQTMRRWDKSGKLRAQRDSQGQRMYPRKLLKEFIEHHDFTPEVQLHSNQVPADAQVPFAATTGEQHNAMPQGMTSVASAHDTAETVLSEPALEQQTHEDERLVDSVADAIEQASAKPAEETLLNTVTALEKSAETKQSVSENALSPIRDKTANLAEDMEQMPEHAATQQTAQAVATNEPLIHQAADGSTVGFTKEDADEFKQSVLQQLQQIESRLQSRSQKLENQIKEIQDRLKVIGEKAKQPVQLPKEIPVESIRSSINQQAVAVTAAEYAPNGMLLKPQIEDHGTSAVGSATLPKGSPKMVIKTRAVKQNSVIFVTPITPTTAPLAVPIAIANEGFAVTIAAIQNQDIRYNWFVISEKSKT